MNDLSHAAAGRQQCCGPLPGAVPSVLLLLFLVGLAFAIFILAVVRNALLLISILLLAALVLAFLFWNAAAHRRKLAVQFFLERFPETDLRSAKDGQLVKVTGFASCRDLCLESSYEKVGRCLYTSALLYEYIGCRAKRVHANNRCFQWNLAYMERFIIDFFITDMKSGTRALVKAGHDSKVTPLIHENILVNVTSKNGELSSTLKKWLHGRHLSLEARPLRLEEGYVKEGSTLTVMGMLSRKNGELMIVPPPETISTGCLWQKFLLPIDFEGLLLKASDTTNSRTGLSLP